MHKIKGTHGIKGVLELSNVKLQVVKGGSYSLSDDDFHSSDVQIALKMGYITHESATKEKKQDNNDESRKVRCRNTHIRSLSLPVFSGEIKPEQEFIINEADLKNDHIQAAVAKGWLDVVSTVDPSDYSEGFMKIADIFAEQQSKEEPEKRTEANEFKQELENMFDEEKEFETNEELTISVTPSNIIDTENPEPIDPKNIPDAKKSSVTWNPTNAPVINEMKNTDTTPLVKEGQGDEMSFVDKEAEEQRIKSHPKLKNKEVEQNKELDFI